MSLGKNDIVKNILFKAQISSANSHQLLNSFIKLIKVKSKNKVVKISNFGSFYQLKTPERIGRNPKTKQEYLITARSKLNLNTSEKSSLG